MEATARYTRSVYETYLTGLDSRKDDIQFKANSKYFKKTVLYADAKYTNSFQGIIGDTSSASLGLGGQHKRNLYRGTLALSLDYRVTDSTYEGGTDTYTTLRYSLGYNRALLRKIGWSALFERLEEDSQDSFTNNTSLTNSLSYALRSWLLTAEHNYTLLEDLNNEVARTSIMLRASRTFIRLWR